MLSFVFRCAVVVSLGVCVAGAPAAASDVEWRPLEGSQGEGVEGDPFYARVDALHVFDDGFKPDLYVGGNFGAAGGIVGTAGIARWDGQEWSAVGSGIGPVVYAMETFVNGGGPNLFAGGRFRGGTTTPSAVARWDGESWTFIGEDLDGIVYALEVFDDGSGPALYAGGEFVLNGSEAAQNLARWNGVAWSAVGGGLDGPVRSLRAFDDGSGPGLFVGGEFTVAGETVAGGIARWNGETWSALGSGIGGGSVTPAVLAMTDFDDGSGSNLYVGGTFTEIDGQPASHIARWDGSQWSSVGPGVGAGFGGAVRSFAVQQGDGGSVLYVAGSFFDAGNISARHLAKWDGIAWSPEGPRFNRTMRALAVYNDADGSTVYAGGDVEWGCGQTFSRIARRGLRIDPPCDADINRDGAVDLIDLNIVLQRFELSPSCGDANSDGEVNLADLNVVLAAFGTTCPE